MHATSGQAVEYAVPQGSARRGRWLAAVLTASLALRLAFSFFWPGSVEWSDAKGYHELALNILHDGTFPTAFYAPGYPAFVAAIYALFGEQHLPVLIVQSVLGTLGVWVTYLTGSDALGRARSGMALLAAALFGLSPGVAYYSAWLLREGVLVLLIPLLAWLCLRMLQRTWRYAVPLGLTAGALAYVRLEGGLLVAVMLVLGLLHKRWRRRAIGGGLLAGAIAVAGAAPWVVYCSLARGYASMQVSLGPNLFARTWHLSPTGEVEPELRRQVLDRIAELGLSERQQRDWDVAGAILVETPADDLPSWLELNRRLTAIAWENSRRHPLGYLATLPLDMLRTMGGEPFTWWQTRWVPSLAELRRDRHWGVLALRLFNHAVWPAVVLPLVLGGAAWAVWRRDRSAGALITLLVAVSVCILAMTMLATKGEARYRVPYDGLLYLAMGVGFAAATRRIRALPTAP
jgi:hypothetical protein